MFCGNNSSSSFGRSRGHAAGVVRFQPPTAANTAIQGLSLAAIRRGSLIRHLTAPRLAERLYAANSWPVSAEWARRFAAPDYLAGILGLEPGRPAAKAVARRWGEIALGPAHWWSWESASAPGNILRFKVYLSPTLVGLGPAWRAAIPILIESGCPAFKIGGTLEQLLRPDKWVAYFFDHRDQLRAAAALAKALQGLPAQGVPFTASVDRSAMVSWAVDPPIDAKERVGSHDSWRSWLTARLARYLVAGRKGSETAQTSLQLALGRLRRDGVDVERWVRADSHWLAAPNGGGIRTG
ncbi:MAG: hypothetical protein ACKVZ0_17365 [Gemmatimonadales bacterium]